MPAVVGVDERDLFRNQEGFLSQNIIATCSFDLQFQYVLAGWEGSSSDQRILNSALTREDSLHIPEGIFFIMNIIYIFLLTMENLLKHLLLTMENLLKHGYMLSCRQILPCQCKLHKYARFHCHI